MNAFTPYIANEHLARLMIEAEEARSARQASAGSSPVSRLSQALRSLGIRRRTPAAPALA
jgi:hypothetical protein